jgi:predicted acyl esterase
MLLADVHRPAEPGRYPVLLAVSPYPRQIQNLGAPAGFIETGASDFFVPRGYVHVIANCRGTSGFGGPSVSLMGIAMTCTTSSNGPRSNPGQTAMSA